MTVRHMALFRFAAGTSVEQIGALSAGLSELPQVIPEIRSYRHGRDVGVNPTSWDYAVIGEFDSVDDYLTYRDHPVHQQLIRERVQPIVADRASVQLSFN